MGEPMSNPRPEPLDSAVLRHAEHGLGIRDLPVIFDLPLPLAIKRTDEFSRYVHPLLQAYCAKCHDAQFQGEFQLVPIKSRADRSSNALRPTWTPRCDSSTPRTLRKVSCSPARSCRTVRAPVAGRSSRARTTGPTWSSPAGSINCPPQRKRRLRSSRAIRSAVGKR